MEAVVPGYAKGDLKDVIGKDSFAQAEFYHMMVDITLKVG